MTETSNNKKYDIDELLNNNVFNKYDLESNNDDKSDNNIENCNDKYKNYMLNYICSNLFFYKCLFIIRQIGIHSILAVCFVFYIIYSFIYLLLLDFIYSIYIELNDSK